jgi:hypothetical protein
MASDDAGGWRRGKQLTSKTRLRNPLEPKPQQRAHFTFRYPMFEEIHNVEYR